MVIITDDYPNIVVDETLKCWKEFCGWSSVYGWDPVEAGMREEWCGSQNLVELVSVRLRVVNVYGCLKCLIEKGLDCAFEEWRRESGQDSC